MVVPEAVRYILGAINDAIAVGRRKGSRYGLGAHAGLCHGDGGPRAAGAEGLPHSSTVVCHPIYAGTESGLSDTSTTSHDREPLRTLQASPVG